MKILYIANRSELFSGGQISLLELVSRVDKTRFEPVVLCPGEGGLSEKLREAGIKVVIWDMPTARTINVPGTKEKVTELRNIIRDLDIDIVHTNGSRGQFYASLAAKGTKARLVWHVRESKKDILLYDLFLADASDRIICVSDSVRRMRFGSYKWILPKISVIYNGVDTGKFAKGEGEAAGKELGIGPGEKVLGMIGLLVPLKGHMFLLDALKPVFSKYPEVKLLIMGKAVDEKYASELREKIKEIGAEKNVIFEEPREDVKGILTMLDVFILPSQREGFSRILLEAMACSTPIIASDVSGNNEAITDGETGILVPYEEVSRLSGAVETMLESPGEAEKMGQNARRRVEEFFGIDEHVYKIQKLYYEVIGSAASLTLCRAVKEFLKKLKKYIIWKTGFLTNRPDSKFTLIVPKRFQPLYHSRVDYHGPWIENYFYNFWCGRQKELKESKIDRIYIPIFWTDYYVRHSRWEPNEELQEFINKNIESDKKYFTIVQNADGIIEKIPDNVLVFSAGGAGDVPIPLIKGGLKRGKDVERDIKVSFMGNLAHEVRIRMYEALKDKKGYYFGGGTIKEFIDTAKRSVFTLCPRGYGKTSYRLYEAIALGSIPVYIWDDVEWLPYKDELSWDEFSVSMNIKDIERLPEIIEGHTPEMIKQKQNKLKELYKEYFTMPGVCWQIVKRLEKHP